jgi:ankyrin repeat protein
VYACSFSDMIGVANGTALHRAAWSGDLAMVQRLVAKGADISNRENPFRGTPMGWAWHNHQMEVVRWIQQASCRGGGSAAAGTRCAAL